MQDGGAEWLPLPLMIPRLPQLLAETELFDQGAIALDVGLLQVVQKLAALANEHSTDGGSNTNGGLYENVFAGQMVEAFDAWVFDETRKPGDYGIVKTQFGHHLMYFVSASEHDAWYEYAYNDAISYSYGFNNDLASAMADNELVPALDKVVLSDVAQEPAEETPTETTPETTAAAE